MMESLEIDFFWASKFGLGLSARVEENAVQVGVRLDNPEFQPLISLCSSTQ